MIKDNVIYSGVDDSGSTHYLYTRGDIRISATISKEGSSDMLRNGLDTDAYIKSVIRGAPSRVKCGGDYTLEPCCDYHGNITASLELVTHPIPGCLMDLTDPVYYQYSRGDFSLFASSSADGSLVVCSTSGNLIRQRRWDSYCAMLTGECFAIYTSVETYYRRSANSWYRFNNSGRVIDCEPLEAKFQEFKKRMGVDVA